MSGTCKAYRVEHKAWIKILGQVPDKTFSLELVSSAFMSLFTSQPVSQLPHENGIFWPKVQLTRSVGCDLHWIVTRREFWPSPNGALLLWNSFHFRSSSVLFPFRAPPITKSAPKAQNVELWSPKNWSYQFLFTASTCTEGKKVAAKNEEWIGLKALPNSKLSASSFCLYFAAFVSAHSAAFFGLRLKKPLIGTAAVIGTWDEERN